MYHHLVETLKFARGQRWRLGDPRSHPKLQVRLLRLLGWGVILLPGSGLSMKGGSGPAGGGWREMYVVLGQGRTERDPGVAGTGVRCRSGTISQRTWRVGRV